MLSPLILSACYRCPNAVRGSFAGSLRRKPRTLSQSSPELMSCRRRNPSVATAATRFPVKFPLPQRPPSWTISGLLARRQRLSPERPRREDRAPANMGHLACCAETGDFGNKSFRTFSAGSIASTVKLGAFYVVNRGVVRSRWSMRLRR
jgi:hypothetical protein